MRTWEEVYVEMPPEAKEWFEERPPEIKAMILKTPPIYLYKYSRSPDLVQFVFLVSYNEDGSVTVAITRKYNIVFVERNVFGVNPEHLTPLCEPDSPEAKEYEIDWDKLVTDKDYAEKVFGGSK